MNLFASMKVFHHEFTKVHLKRRAVPLAALVLTTSMTVPVLAAGVDIYEITDGTTTDSVSLYQEDAESALAHSTFDEAEYAIVSVYDTGDNIFRVTVKEKYDVSIAVDGGTVSCHTGDAQVSAILRQAGVELGEDDLVSPSLDTKITEPTQITVTRVTKKQKTETQAVAFTTETRSTSELYTGESRVAQQGVNGVKEITLEYTYHDGVQVSCVQIGEEIITEPINKIVENGTKQPTVATSGGAIAYSRVLTVEATAYSGGGLTASGTRARVGAIAVDPKVIPLGSRLYITSADGKSWVYGYAVAEDTGGAIKGNRIDLYFNSESQCISFGRQTAKVYILK
ncbi:MAG TPA: G5 domain-containing protein [Candidatus Butyricicoccus stercorigallinarum]|nr:G5 domain-containing protein [Candidatus Butyricicoccus stercorigallinarum]